MILRELKHTYEVLLTFTLSTYSTAALMSELGATIEKLPLLEFAPTTLPHAAFLILFLVAVSVSGFSALHGIFYDSRTLISVDRSLHFSMRVGWVIGSTILVLLAVASFLTAYPDSTNSDLLENFLIATHTAYVAAFGLISVKAFSESLNPVKTAIAVRAEDEGKTTHEEVSA